MISPLYGSITPLTVNRNKFNPTKLPGLYLWLDANDLTTLYQNSTMTTPVTGNLNPVGGWADKSGNGRHFIQGNNSSRPAYRTSADGSPGIKFDESDDWLEYTAVSFTSGHEVYIISHATRSSFPGPSSNTDPDLTSGVGGGSTIEMSFYNSFVTQANAVSVTQQMTNHWVDGASYTEFNSVTSNKTHIASATVGSPVSNTGFYMGKYSDNAHYSPDSVKGLLIYDRTHTSIERGIIHQWARTYGGYNLIF